MVNFTLKEILYYLMFMAAFGVALILVGLFVVPGIQLMGVALLGGAGLALACIAPVWVYSKLKPKIKV